MGVIIKQYEGSSVSPKDDAIMHEIFNDQSGVIRGCEITYLGSNQIRIGEGYLYICGRVVQIEEEVIFSQLTTEKTEGELILKIDLLAETPGKLLARTPRTQLTQGDINGEDSVFEYLLATYTVSDAAISRLTIGYEYITAGFSKDKILSTAEELNAVTEPGFLVDALAVKEQFHEQNKKLEWKLVGSVTGKNNIITLPSDFNELDIACKGKDNKYKLHMIREELLDTDTKLITGYGSSSDPNYVSIYCNTSQVKVASMYEKGEDVTNKAVLTVYYR